uniref:NADH dehydrogenase subunit 6 n=1 Tax=Pinnaxodes major TaxID=2921218 RepID=UPI002027D2C6|nr:NADH dehydrogenase subunit 6 [Pinnaxodes major]UPL65048.1 NADH dehydrogenase subunit 6 [Pinnaxodes major]
MSLVHTSEILPFTIPLLIMLTLLFTQLSHPLAMGLILLLQTTLICLSIGFSTFSFWLSYILFLIFLGGMLVLFIYVASLASNESFSFSISKFVLFSFILATSAILLFAPDQMLFCFSSPLVNSSLNFSLTTPLTINWIYNTPFMNFTIFIVFYLLLMLIVVVKIISLSKGPLRLSY